MHKINDRILTEVLVIGGGQAGIVASIECSDSGKEVVIVTKGPFGKDGASTWMAGWGNQMALYAPDSPEIHAADTIRAGMYINNQQLVLNLTKELPDLFNKLKKWKIRYHIINNKVVQFKIPGGQTYPRILELERKGELGGLEYRRVLPHQVRKRPIKIISDIIIFDLLMNNHQVVGAVGLNIQKGTFVVIEAKVTILATGGFIGLYDYSTGSPSITGDGLAMAYKAGAKFRDMEFINFHSLIACWPPIIRGQGYTVSVFYGLGGKILNNKGLDFRKKHPDKGKLSTSVIIQQEIMSPRASLHGGVYCSFRHVSQEQIQNFIDTNNPQKHLDTILNVARIDLKKDGMEIAPCPLASNGGCDIDENCFTKVPGLIAAGEVVGGHEGASTMAGNTIALQFAMGFIAGKSAVKITSETAHIPSAQPAEVNNIVDGAMSILESADKYGPSPIEIKMKIQNILADYLHLAGRNRENLTKAIDEIQSLKADCDNMQLKCKEPDFNVEWVEGLECKNAITVLEMAVRAALTRTESRGFHYREDFPDRDNERWIKTVFLQKKGPDMKVWTEDVDMPFMSL